MLFNTNATTYKNEFRGQTAEQFRVTFLLSAKSVERIERRIKKSGSADLTVRGDKYRVTSAHS